MAWKKIIVGSENGTGAVLPTDLTSAGTPLVEGSVLSVTGNGTGINWAPDNVYTHPTHTITPLNIAESGSEDTIIDNINISLTTDGLGHISALSGGAGTRVLTLADLGYTGHPNANDYDHPTYAGDSFNIPLTTADNEVISSLQINLETDTMGHVVDATASHAVRTMTLANLGYTGAGNADAYGGWNAEINNGNAQSIFSGGTVDLRGEGNVTISSSYDTPSNTLDVKFNADADYVGHITEVKAGLGMDFTTLDDTNPNGAISLGTPSTISSSTGNDFLVGVDGAVSTNPEQATSHTHAITAYADTTSNAGNLLKSTDAGHLKLVDLEVTSSLVVDGTELTLGSDNLTIADNEVQINWDTSSNNYFDADSAIIFGNSTNAHGCKIINTDTVVKITDIPSGETASEGGTVVAGNAKQVHCGDIEAENVQCGSVTASGNIQTTASAEVGQYLQFNDLASAPTDEVGRIYYDGNDFWVNL
tara:strand:- start:7034 stop:8464 length:1431 start_codon:yes stop_codon:yes gene_type:complete